MSTIQKRVPFLMPCFAGIAIAADEINIRGADVDILVKLLNGMA